MFVNIIFAILKMVIEMAKLYFFYGAMNSGKTTRILQCNYNYEEQGMRAIIMKPKTDTKGMDKIVSRIGATKKVDYLIDKNENVFDLTTAILSKDKQKMMSIYKDLMTINEEPVKLIVLVANSMRLIYQVKLLDRKGYTDQEIAKMLAVNPFRLKYVRKEGQFFQIDELLRCLNELSLLDVKIKTGQIDKKLGLELFMLRI